jgi:hypothetical protein
MNDPDNFLSRWSRRKREAEEGKEKKENEEAVSAARAAPTPESEADKVTAPADESPVPEFDATSLPPVESIGAETDITAFMRTDVPETLKHAALRRAWSSDPAIRDFVGLNENFWDAAGPDGIAGFGDLDPGFDVRRMVSELFGETPRQDISPESETRRAADSPEVPVQNRTEAVEVPPSPPTLSEDVVQRNENAAPQTETSEHSPTKKIARRHGGAMPQ